MKTKPIIFKRVIIFDGDKDIGYIQLVRGVQKPQLEFSLIEECRNKGIMTQELTKYLEKRKRDYPQLVAIVKQDNIASAKALDKVGFVRFSIIGELHIYMADLRLGREVLADYIEKFNIGLIDK